MRSDVRRRLLGVAVWISLILGYVWFARSRDLGPVEAAEELRGVLADNWWGPAVFIAFYMVRPLVLFPATILTVLGGLAFGPVWGSVWTVLATTLSTAVTYAVGRFFGSDRLVTKFRTLTGRLLDQALDRPFETALIMRLLYLPFDLVGYAAGFLRLRYVPFAIGSLIGTVPGTLAFVGFGASVDSLDEGLPSFDPWILVSSIVLAIAGSLVARWLRSRQTPDWNGLVE